MPELPLCYVLERCVECPASKIGSELGEVAVDIAKKTLFDLGNDPQRVVTEKIPGVKALVEANFPERLGEAEKLFIAPAAAQIIWWAAVGTNCEPNNQTLIRRNY